MWRSPLVRCLSCGMCMVLVVMWINVPEDNSMVRLEDVIKFHRPTRPIKQSNPKQQQKHAQPPIEPDTVTAAADVDKAAVDVLDNAPGAEAATDPDDPVPMCTNDERLRLIKQQCASSTVTSLDDLTVFERHISFSHMFVDTKHKLMACLPPKSGCTTWKNILANNSRDEPLHKDFNMMDLHYGEGLKPFGIFTLRAFSKSAQVTILNNYTKFLVARHPLERFRSAYIDKLSSGKDSVMQEEIGAPILELYHPDLPATARASGKGVTIDMFTRYLKKSHLYNAHWHPVHELCQPCLINYDYVLKTETLDHDNELMILEYLHPYTRGLGTKGNIVAGGNQVSSLTPRGRELEIYVNSSISDMSYLQEMYARDFREFGYSWKYTEEGDGRYSVRSSCIHGSPDRQCC